MLLGLFRGLHCPFCRRQVAQLNAASATLREIGVRAVGVINTTLERAKVYYGPRRLDIVLAADPDWDVHGRYGLIRIALTAGETDWPRTLNKTEWSAVRGNPTGELAESLHPIDGNAALNKLHGFALTETDEKIMMAHGMTGAGYFLIDKTGVIRWAWREGEAGANTMAVFPSRDDLLDAARTVMAGAS